jgi:16S rRNA (uracil1498-N3)-methyltransferase
MNRSHAQACTDVAPALAPPRHRFYCPTLAGATLSDIAVLTQEEARHALRVLRLRVGDRVELFDGQGCTAIGVIAAAQRHAVDVRVESRRVQPPLVPRLVIASALPKGARAADLINQLSQLGVDQFTPLLTQRGVRQSSEHTTPRLQRGALEAAKQCRRDFLLHIGAAQTLDDLLAEIAPRPQAGPDRGENPGDPGGNEREASPVNPPHPVDPNPDLGPPRRPRVQLESLALIASPTDDALPWSALLPRVSAASHVCVLIGPEGGFTQDEEDTARRHGALPWRLGPFILRIETAAAAAAAMLRGGLPGS